MHSMVMSRTDPRAERSRKALQKAMVSLIKEKDYDDIQIQEITDRADTAKVTFYRHYRKKDDLLLDLIVQTAEELRPLAAEKSLEDLTDLTRQPPPLLMFLILETDRVFYKRLCQSPKLSLILLEFRRVGVAQIRSDTPALSAFEADQIIASVMGSVLWWLLNDIPYSGEQMARIAHTLSIGGVMALRENVERLGVEG